MKKSRYLSKAGSIDTPMLVTPLRKCTNFKVVFMFCMLSILTLTSGFCQWTPASNCTGNGSKLTGTVLGSSDRSWNDRGYTKEKVFDDDNDTYFDAPTGNNQWAGLDLGSIKRLTCIMFRPRTEWPSRMTGGLIQIGSDAAFTNPVTIYTMPSTIDVQDYYIINIQAVSDTETRYVRYLSPDGGYGNIAEMKVYGKEIISKPGQASTNTFPLSGFVGIGTTNPNKELDVVGTIKATNMVATDKVGIGTKTPSTELDVVGTVKASNVEATGKVGIGTDKPSTELDVAGTIKATGFELPTADAGDKKVLTSNDKGVATWRLLPSLSSISKGGKGSENEIGLEVYQPDMEDYNGFMFQIGKSNTAKNAGNLKFINKGDASENNLLTLGFQGKEDVLNVEATGKVGIGTGKPSTELDVVGTIKATNVEATGKVGIGTDKPSTELDVAGTIKATDLDVAGTIKATGFELPTADAGDKKVLTSNDKGVATWQLLPSLSSISKGGKGSENEIGLEVYQPDMEDYNGFMFQIGKSNTAKNAGNLKFINKGDASENNLLTLGFQGKEDVLNVEATGKVGIGTGKPSTELDVVGTIKATNVEATGKVGIGTDKPSTELDVAGTIKATDLDVAGTIKATGFELPTADAGDKKVLTSNDKGVATWQLLPSLSSISKGGKGSENEIGLEVYQPDMEDYNGFMFQIGKSNTAKNAGNLKFINRGDASENNLLTLGFQGKEDVLNVEATGKVGIGIEKPSTELDVAGTIKATGFELPTADAGDKKVLTSNDKGVATWQLLPSLSSISKGGKGSENEIGLEVYQPDMEDYNGFMFQIGKSNTAKNAGNLKFINRGDASENNLLTLGFQGKEDVLNVEATGKVGIGIEKPSTELDVAGTIKATGFELPTADAGDKKVLTSNDKGVATWQFLPSLDSISKEGTGSKNEIGLKVYQPGMGVNNGLMFQIGKSNTAKNAGNLKFINKGDASENNLLTLGFQGKDTILNVAATGKVGIGTTTPGKELDVAGTIKATGFELSTADAGNNKVLTSNDTGVATWQFLPSLDSISKEGTGSKNEIGLKVYQPGMGVNNGLMFQIGKSNTAKNAGNLKFINKGDASENNLLTLGFQGKDTILNVAATGKVGIGTTTPGKELDVAGTIKATGFELSTADAGNNKVLTSNDTGVATWKVPQTNFSDNLTVTVPAPGTFASFRFKKTLPGSAPVTLSPGLVIGGSLTNNTTSKSDIMFSINNFNTDGTDYRTNFLKFESNPAVTEGGDMATLALPGKITAYHPLEVQGTIIAGGLTLDKDAGDGKVLTSDRNGVATWKNSNPSTLENVGIGTKPSSSHKLTVSGYTYIGAGDATPKGFTVNAQTRKFLLWVEGGVVSEDFAIAQSSSWKDNVFNEGYRLPSLSEIEKYIQQNKHLPGIPSEMEVKEKGYSLNELNKAFLEKIEHLTLYSIEQEKKITKLETQLSQYESLKRELEEIKSALRNNSKN